MTRTEQGHGQVSSFGFHSRGMQLYYLNHLSLPLSLILTVPSRDEGRQQEGKGILGHQVLKRKSWVCQPSCMYVLL